jgi:UDP-N-acetylmuramyl pentapeptide synthase
LLVRDLKDRPLDRIYLIGEGYDSCSQAVSKDTRIVRMEMVDLQRQFEALLKAGDVVMLKGSNSTGLYRFADRFRQN